MNDATVRRVVRGKIADGSLPRDRIGAVSVTYGTDEVCDACSASVSPGEVLYKLTRAAQKDSYSTANVLSSGEMSGTVCPQVRRYWTSVYENAAEPEGAATRGRPLPFRAMAGRGRSAGARHELLSHFPSCGVTLRTCSLQSQEPSPTRPCPPTEEASS